MVPGRHAPAASCLKHGTSFRILLDECCHAFSFAATKDSEVLPHEVAHFGKGRLANHLLEVTQKLLSAMGLLKPAGLLAQDSGASCPAEHPGTPSLVRDIVDIPRKPAFL